MSRFVLPCFFLRHFPFPFGAPIPRSPRTPRRSVQDRRLSLRRHPNQDAAQRPEGLPQAGARLPVVTTMVAYKVGSADEELDTPACRTISNT